MLYGFWRLQVRGRHPTGEAFEREDIRMRHERCLAAFLGVLLWGATGRADITMTTPYDYDHPPKPGTERGTYMAAATGSFGPDCFFTFIGTAKYLPNPDGSGGKHCTKGNVELSGSGPGCAFKPYETMPVVTETDYTYNGDGTLCERVRFVGGPLAGTEFPFHTYVDPNGRWVFPTTQDIAYPCPNAASNITGINSQGPGFKIGAFGDDPAGSGQLPCTNP